MKTYVKVLVEFSSEGVKRPLYIYWNNDIKYEVAEVHNVTPKINVDNACSIGEKYEITVNNTRTFLFFEDDQWFIEESV